MSFQRQVNLTPAPAVVGDFASTNPRATVLAGPGGLVAGPEGVTVGKFAWVDADGITVHSHGTAPHAPAGFVHREQQGLISQYLAEQSMVIPAGWPVVLHNQGDFFAKVEGANAAAVGAALYADYDTGGVTVGSATASASATGSIGATTTASQGATFTATGTGTSLVVTGVTGVITVGETISGTGVPANTTIAAQVSGTPGGAGTYTTSQATTAAAATVTSFGTTLTVTAATGYLSVGDTVSGGAGLPVGATIVSQTSGTTGGTGSYVLSAAATAYTASGTVTAFGDVLHVTTVASGALAVGKPVTGTGVPTGAIITAQIDGTAGGAGNYRISPAATAYAASTALTVVGGVLTNWTAQSAAAVGELTKISTWG